MSKILLGFLLGLFVGFIGILAIVYYAKGDWVSFKLIVLDIADSIDKFINAYFRSILLMISIIIGGMIAYLIYEIVDINSYKKGKEAEIKEVENTINQLIKEAEQEAEYIKNIALERGYIEGKEKHKKELKSLRNRLSAVRSIFKKHPELNDCFRNITGWDFEKWLKER